jgi:hypothetical protein
MVELSGLVASRSQDVLYGHNDSGDAARFFALSVRDGRLLQEFVLEGATNRDWEDVALAPCGSGVCLFLGDIGDNRLKRTEYVIYRVPEPTVTEGAPKMAVPYDRIPFQYPEGARHNAEALMADPKSGQLYVLTKEPLGKPSLVFRFPLQLVANSTVTLEALGNLSVPTPSDPQLTAADVSPCGDAVLVRLYNRLLLFRSPQGTLEDALKATPEQVPAAQEAQGESVAFSSSGASYFTASETLTTPPFLYQSVCE